MTLEMFENLPGLSGLYISAAFCGTLSTVSSGINSMSTCFVTDFIRRNEVKLFRKRLSDNVYSILGKIFVLVFGLLCIGFSYICDSLGQMLQATISKLTFFLSCLPIYLLNSKILV